MTVSTPVAAFAEVVTVSRSQCPACDRSGGRVFYEVDGVPTSDVRLMYTREEALGCDRGDLRLAFCEGCGFIWNTAFRPESVSYEHDYESTQALSPTFNRFHEALARELFERYQLADKEVFEIGCGQGEFVHLLAASGTKHAVGFDPALREPETADNLTLIKDWYSETYTDRSPDVIVTKMTMEHIPDPHRFLSMIRRTVRDRPDVGIFCMVPESRRILEGRCFWDIYYEHCAYFTLGSLARAFRSTGFDVLDLYTGYGEQYCILAARPGAGTGAPEPREETLDQLTSMVDSFAVDVVRRHQRWQRWLREEAARDRTTVLWGSGSKAVSFLTTLGIGDEVACAVDINPRRSGTYMPGTGHEIHEPKALTDRAPDNVIVMNSIYVDEIAADLASMGLAPDLRAIDDTPPAAP
jgi:SAM-dependent methyltransferase